MYGHSGGWRFNPRQLSATTRTQRRVNRNADFVCGKNGCKHVTEHVQLRLPSFERVFLFQVDQRMFQIVFEAFGMFQQLFGRRGPLAFKMDELFPC
jgi:hypothetical protein